MKNKINYHNNNNNQIIINIVDNNKMIYNNKNNNQIINNNVDNNNKKIIKNAVYNYITLNLINWLKFQVLILFSQIPKIKIIQKKYIKLYILNFLFALYFIMSLINFFEFKNVAQFQFGCF